MKLPTLSRQQRAYMKCAPFNDERINDRSMRSTVFRVRKADEFAKQRSFDRAIAALAQAVPLPGEVTEWLSKEPLIAPRKPTWRRDARNPVILAIGIAVAVIAGIVAYRAYERMHDFPGAETARKLLTVASSTRTVMLDPVKTDAGSLGDLFFMKHQLEHYDVPPEFAEFRTVGCRVFHDEEAHRIAQIWVVEKRMQFFLFPAEKNLKTGATEEFSGWRYVENEGWTGAVKEQSGVCFMVALRGREKDIGPYLSKSKP